jgi:hypothetical protein
MRDGYDSGASEFKVDRREEVRIKFGARMWNRLHVARGFRGSCSIACQDVKQVCVLRLGRRRGWATASS